MSLSLGPYKTPEKVVDALAWVGYIDAVLSIDIQFPENPMQKIRDLTQKMLDYTQYLDTAKSLLNEQMQATQNRMNQVYGNGEINENDKFAEELTNMRKLHQEEMAAAYIDEPVLKRVRTKTGATHKQTIREYRKFNILSKDELKYIGDGMLNKPALFFKSDCKFSGTVGLDVYIYEYGHDLDKYLMEVYKIPETKEKSNSEKEYNDGQERLKKLKEDIKEKAKYTETREVDEYRDDLVCVGTRKVKNPDSKVNKMDAKEKRAKMKQIAKEIASEQRSETLEKSKAAFKETYEKQIQELRDSFKKIGDEYVELFRNLQKEFSSGEAKKNVQAMVDQFDNAVNQVTSTVQDLIVQISMMVAKIPTPGAIGACVTNPGYSIETMMTDLKAVLAQVQKIIALVMSIVEIIKNLKLDKLPKNLISIKDKYKDYLDIVFPEPIPTIIGLAEKLNDKEKEMEEKLKDTQEQLSEAKAKMVEELESQLTPIYVTTKEDTPRVLKDNEDHTEIDSKLVAYKSPVMSRPANYRYDEKDKNGGGFNHENGTYGYDEDIKLVGWNIYRKNNRNTFWYFYPIGDKNISEQIKDVPNDLSASKYTAATIINEHPFNANGKIINVDGRHYLVDSSIKSGDIVKLPNGTIVKIS